MAQSIPTPSGRIASKAMLLCPKFTITHIAINLLASTSNKNSVLKKIIPGIESLMMFHKALLATGMLHTGKEIK